MLGNFIKMCDNLLIDNYSHISNDVVYIYENILGPAINSDTYKNIVNDYNSQLSKCCECKQCSQNIKSCICLDLSGGSNYTSYIEKESNKFSLILNEAKNLKNSLIIECNDLCKCTDVCGNRLVQRGPIDNLVPKVCDIKSKGIGLFTSKFIVKGSFICEYAGELITMSQAIDRHQSNVSKGRMNYIFCLNEYCNNTITQTIIDPTYFGNIGRYINHSCEPNCEIIPVRVNSPIPKLAIYSSMNIIPGSELTFDYGSNNVSSINIDSADNRKACLCKSQNCRSFIPNEAF